MTQEKKRTLTLQYLNDWIKITGEGYDTTFTYTKAASFLRDFFMLETEAQKGAFRLSLRYIDDTGLELGTAHLIVIRQPANGEKEERCELIPDFENLSHTSSRGDLLLSGVSVIYSDYNRDNAHLHTGSSLIDLTVGKTSIASAPIKVALISTQCKQGRKSENTMIEMALENAKVRYIAFPHALCEVDLSNGRPTPLTRFSNSLSPSAKFSDTRYLPFSIGFKISLMVAELESAGYPKNWMINFNSFNEKQEHWINPLIKASSTFHIDDVQYLDNEAVQEAALFIRSESVNLFRKKILSSVKENKGKDVLSSMLSVTNDEERALLFEATLTLRGSNYSDKEKVEARNLSEQFKEGGLDVDTFLERCLSTALS